MRALKLLLFVAVFALVPAVAWADKAAGTGIAGTDHDFSNEGGGIGLCTFCHTPHRAISTLLLWNHTLSQAQYNWDVPSTTAGTPFPTSISGQTYSGPSTKCLSCHDGSVAVGDIAWWNEGKPAQPLTNEKHPWPDAFNVGATNGVLGSMKGNHPVMMPYPNWNGGGKSTYNGVMTGSQITLGEWRTNPETLNIRMFNDNGAGNITAGGVSGKTGIECSSCHDPHNKASVDDLFLRGEMKGTTTAYICLKCHDK